MRLATLISRFVLLFLLISNALAGQVSESSYITLRKELVKKVNALRLDLGLPILKNSIILRKAAKNQCLYMVKSRKLTHKQGNRKLANPLKRVRNFKGYEFERVGENVLHTKPVKLPLRNKYLELLADEMFMSWKNSPGHYENMINPDYEFSGIDFMYSPKEKIIYAAQVFGKRGVQIPGQLSNSAFGIEDKEEPCDCELYGYSNILANMGNSVRLDGNKVVFYYYDLQYFNKIFKDSKDGIAIDLVYRDQLSCDGPSRID